MTYSKFLVNGNATIGFNQLRIQQADQETSNDFVTFLLDSNKNLIATIITNGKPNLKLDFKSDWKVLNTRNCYFKMV